MCVDFRGTIELFREYRRALDALPETEATHNAALVGEVEHRLEQLDFILGRIRQLDQARIEFLTRNDPLLPHSKFTRLNAFEIRLLSESFYYFAGRLRSIIRHKDRPCPRLNQFECKGVRDVRNHLLEHPEGSASRVFNWSWTVGGEEGPVLKVYRDPEQEDIFPDHGLYKNAQELIDNLSAQLHRVLSQISA